MYELLFAGHETTTAMIGNPLRQLLSHRHAWEEICGDPALIPNAVEEVRRFDSSVIAWRRKTTQPVEIGGVSVPAEANLLLLLGSANRDPAVFEESRALRHPPEQRQGGPLLRTGGALLSECTPGSAGGAGRAGGAQRAHSQPAISAGTDAAVPAQHDVPWTTLAVGRVGRLTAFRKK